MLRCAGRIEQLARLLQVGVAQAGVVQHPGHAQRPGETVAAEPAPLLLDGMRLAGEFGIGRHTRAPGRLRARSTPACCSSTSSSAWLSRGLRHSTCSIGGDQRQLVRQVAVRQLAAAPRIRAATSPPAPVRCCARTCAATRAHGQGACGQGGGGHPRQPRAASGFTRPGRPWQAQPLEVAVGRAVIDHFAALISITRWAEPMVSGRCAMTMRVTCSAAIDSLTWASRLTSRWLVASSSSSTCGACTGLVPASRAAFVRPRARCPCRPPASGSPWAWLDVVVDGGQPGAFFDAFGVGAGVEEADVLGNRAGKQRVVLHHGAYQWSATASLPI
jgi:hypothetical protein